jgi:hypothetical protein
MVDAQIKADFDALTKDAQTWTTVGDALAEANTTVTHIGMYRGAFSFAATDVADRYQAIHQQVMQLLADGATATHAGAAALLAIRADFEKYEDVTACDLYSMWQPVH